MFRFRSFTYILTQLPTQFYSDSLHPNSILRIPILIFWILHIPTLIPHIPIPHVAFIPIPIPPHSPHFVTWFPILAFTDSHFLLMTQNQLSISENLNYWIDRECQYCKTVISITRSISFSKKQFKKISAHYNNELLLKTYQHLRNTCYKLRPVLVKLLV